MKSGLCLVVELHSSWIKLRCVPPWIISNGLVPDRGAERIARRQDRLFCRTGTSLCRAPGPLHHDFPDGFGLRQDRRFRDAEVFPAFFQVVSFAAVGEKAVIADAHQAFGKRVKKKSSNEFHRVDGHGLDGSLLAVFVREGDLSVGKIEDPAVGDRDPVRVAADVVDDAVGVVERRFHVDDPCLGPQDVFQLSETVRGCIFGRVSGECEFGFVVRLLQVEHELAPEDLRQGAFRKKPVVFAGDPVLAVRGQRSRGER